MFGCVGCKSCVINISGSSTSACCGLRCDEGRNVVVGRAGCCGDCCNAVCGCECSSSKRFNRVIVC